MYKTIKEKPRFKVNYDPKKIIRVNRIARKNRPLIEMDGDVAELYGTRQGETIIVICGGPSTSDNLGFLRRTSNPIIAVNTAVKPLLNWGVVPSYVVAGDPDEPLVDHLDIDRDDIPLVYGHYCNTNAVRNWKGPRYCSYVDLRGAPCKYRDEVPRGELRCQCTVSENGLELAERLGAAKVLIFGLDLSYPHGQHHIGGVSSAHESRLVYWKDGKGNKVLTDGRFLFYLQACEEIIDSHKHVEWIKVGKNGLPMDGTRWAERKDLR